MLKCVLDVKYVICSQLKIALFWTINSCLSNMRTRYLAGVSHTEVEIAVSSFIDHITGLVLQQETLCFFHLHLPSGITTHPSSSLLDCGN